MYKIIGTLLLLSALLRGAILIRAATTEQLSRGARGIGALLIIGQIVSIMWIWAALGM